MSTHQAALPLCQARYSQLLIIDAQERLAAHMPKNELSIAICNTNRLIDAAKLLDIPIINTEQNSKGLGPTIESVRDHLPDDITTTDKTCFSCCTAGGFERDLTQDEKRKQVVMVGMESHICILQTASGLQHWGYQVFVVADAVCSRNPANRDNALERMRHCGIQVTNAESVAFEWMADSGHVKFREVSKLFK
jgi:nicotinamidase-related amidase